MSGVSRARTLLSGHSTHLGHFFGETTFPVRLKSPNNRRAGVLARACNHRSADPSDIRPCPGPGSHPCQGLRALAGIGDASVKGSQGPPSSLGPFSLPLPVSTLYSLTHPTSHQHVPQPRWESRCHCRRRASGRSPPTRSTTPRTHTELPALARSEQTR